MKKAILGKKIGMTQVFLNDGRLVPVTVVEAGPCTVTMVKTQESDGYEAVQVGFGELTEQRAMKLKNKPELGHFKKAGVAPTRYLRELRFDDISSYKVGDVITVGGIIKNFYGTVEFNIPSLMANPVAEGVTVSGAVVGHDGVGGIVGRLIISGTIEDCTNNASVTSTYGGIGGIVGKAYYTGAINLKEAIEVAK